MTERKVIPREELDKSKHEVVENWDDGYVFVKVKDKVHVLKELPESYSRTPGLPE